MMLQALQAALFCFKLYLIYDTLARACPHNPLPPWKFHRPRGERTLYFELYFYLWVVFFRVEVGVLYVYVYTHIHHIWMFHIAPSCTLDYSDTVSKTKN